MDISVIIPTYRETDRLNVTLQEIFPYLENKFQSFEILIVDDPDTEGHYTQLLAPFDRSDKIQFLKQNKRFGKGAAVKRGCLQGQGDVILFMDADHSTPIEELNAFLPFLANDENCLVAGARTYQEDESKWRRILGLAAQLFLHLVLFKKAVVDSQCGFKAFRRPLVQKIFPLLQVQGGMIDAEIFYLMHKFGYRAYYVPVLWANKPGTRINIVRCMIYDPIDIFKVVLRNFFGAYNKA